MNMYTVLFCVFVWFMFSFCNVSIKYLLISKDLLLNNKAQDNKFQRNSFVAQYSLFSVWNMLTNPFNSVDTKIGFMLLIRYIHRLSILKCDIKNHRGKMTHICFSTQDNHFITLFLVAWFNSSSSQYMKRCLRMVSWHIRNKLQRNLNQSTPTSIHQMHLDILSHHRRVT